MEEQKNKIRPIYSELQGYLSQTISPKLSSDFTRDSSLWEQYNETIDELNKVSENNYDRFKIQPQNASSGYYVIILTYRNKLGGLISRLHGEFFSNEPAPFSGIPTTIISQDQHQNQSFQIQMLLEIQSKIDEKISKFEKESKERTFLEKVKSSLSAVSNISQLITLLLTTGKEIGLTTDQILNLFK